jgi:cytochrome P450
MHDFAADVVKERKQYWIEQNGHLLKGRDQSSNAEFNSETVKAGKKRLVFLDLLLHEHLVNQTLNEEDMREEVETFMFAGHDTTAMAISWTLYLLGLHHDIQDKVRAEVDAIFDEEEAALKNNSNENNNDNDQENDNNNQSNEDSSLTHVTEEMLKKMKYLDCVMKEVQRVYPTAPFIGREITEDTQICGYTVPKGTGAGVLTFLLHRNPRVFPSPERFDPERFRPENCIGRHPYAYVPFSAGVRNCIGQKFALSEQKIVVSSLVRRFVVTSVDQRDKLIVVGEMVLRPKNDLRVIFEPRTDRLFGRREEFKQTSATLHQQNPSERSPSPSPSQSRVL